MCKLAQLNDGKCLSENYVNIMTPLKWEYQKGHRFEAIPNDVKNSNTWCPYCSNKKVCDDNCLAIVTILRIMNTEPKIVSMIGATLGSVPIRLFIPTFLQVLMTINFFSL